MAIAVALAPHGDEPDVGREHGEPTNDFVYFCFPSGNFLMGDKKLDSDSDSKKTPVTDSLSFAAVDDPNINDMYRIYSTSDSDWKDEQTMFKELFPDYTATTNAINTPQPK